MTASATRRATRPSCAPSPTPAACCAPGLHPAAKPGPDDDWSRGTPLTDETDALRARNDHPGNRTLESEQLLIAAYLRLDRDKTTPRNACVPDTLRPWTARVRIQEQETVVYLRAATATGARYAAAETIRLAIADDETARFTPLT